MPLPPNPVFDQNILNQVITYQKASVALLTNMCPQLANWNTKFKNFDKLIGNYGDTFSFDIPPKVSVSPGLIATFPPVEQRVQNVTCDQAWNVSYKFTDQEFIFNAVDYVKNFDEKSLKALGNKVESYLATIAETDIYRFYNVNVNNFASSDQLVSSIKFAEALGSAGQNKAYIPNSIIPAVMSDMFKQFVPRRNEERAASWDIGTLANTDFYTSNLLKFHQSGYAGVNNTLLTVTAVTRGARGEITALTLSTPSGVPVAIPGMILKGDAIWFVDTSDKPNVRFMLEGGVAVAQAPVQLVATDDFASTASSVTIQFKPALYDARSINPLTTDYWYKWAETNVKNQNVNVEISAGMKLKVAQSHIVGYLVMGNAAFLAAPNLGSTYPFASSSESDPQSGFSMRKYYGFQFGLGTNGFVNDLIYGGGLISDYCCKILCPASVLSM